MLFINHTQRENGVGSKQAYSGMTLWYSFIFSLKSKIKYIKWSENLIFIHLFPVYVTLYFQREILYFWHLKLPLHVQISCRNHMTTF